MPKSEESNEGRSTINTACPLDCPDTLTYLSGGPCFNDAKVEVARLATTNKEIFH